MPFGTRTAKRYYRLAGKVSANAAGERPGDPAKQPPADQRLRRSAPAAAVRAYAKDVSARGDLGGRRRNRKERRDDTGFQNTGTDLRRARTSERLEGRNRSGRPRRTVAYLQ